jgi:diaminohydroxyphosphoribosylaminopyrimidine deaminase / 5-amino-6-(5-phosphoribosylamino)uracil reductase
MSEKMSREGDDEKWMRQAMLAAQEVRRSVSPRPWVGAVVVTPDGRSFVGATSGREGPHAEPIALRAAGDAARGSTLYATLEPCAHHGRTPPCVDAIIEAGIARCVVGVLDPDSRVSGRGVQLLRDAGIQVDVGVLEGPIASQLAPYLHHRRTGRPYVVLKLAASLDGRTAASDGTSRWITGPEAREDAHRLRADSDAILVGAGTVRTDDPQLTVRLPEGEADGVSPLRVVLGHAPKGAKIHPCLELSGELGDVLDELGSRGVLQLLVEGGATTAHAFHEAGIPSRYVLYLAPTLFGGENAKGLFAGAGAGTMADLWRGQIVECRTLGSDLRVDLVPNPPTVERAQRSGGPELEPSGSKETSSRATATAASAPPRTAARESLAPTNDSNGGSAATDATVIQILAETLLPTRSGLFRFIVFRSESNQTVAENGLSPDHVALVRGDVRGKRNVFVRVHSECVTSEVFGSLRCDCREQFNKALGDINESDQGIMIYLRQEGRGVGLANKIRAYELQQDGHDTVDSNRMLGLKLQYRRGDAGTPRGGVDRADDQQSDQGRRPA